MAKIEVENVNTLGLISNVDADKYNATRQAILKILPNSEQGLTFGEMKEAAKPHLPENLFPGGKTSGWWCKCVQLDLEAKLIIIRINSKPLRFYRA